MIKSYVMEGLIHSCSFINVKVPLSEKRLLRKDNLFVVEQCPGSIFLDVDHIMAAVDRFS